MDLAWFALKCNGFFLVHAPTFHKAFLVQHFYLFLEQNKQTNKAQVETYPTRS